VAILPTVTVQPDGIAVDLRPGEAVIDGLRRAGWRMRAKCRRGGCGICKSRILIGAVRYPLPVAETALSAAERSTGWCLPCQAVPLVDVVVQRAGDALRPMLASAARPARSDPEER
jgi:ferredoxin